MYRSKDTNMTKLSKLRLDPKDFGLYVNNLWSAFALMDTKDDIRLLFKDIFTHTEYKMFAKRLEIARRLLEGQKYEQISEDLHVTQGTISQVSNILTEKGEGYKKAHEKLTDIEKSIQRRRSRYQDVLERRVRRKLPAEKVLPQLLSAGITALNKSVTKKIKQKSATKQLTL